MCWVCPELIVSTTSDRWGEFGGHREHSLPDIAHGLATASDLDAFTNRLFADAIHLLRISAWAGPIYTLGNGGCHRIHAARLLGLPWLLADVFHPQQGTDWRVSDLLEDRADATKNRAHRMMQRIDGLQRRGIIDAEILPTDTDEPLWTRVRCSRLPAPWLLREPELATTINAAYERCYPGALDQLGIPANVGTQPDKWTDWIADA